ncbi:hypothetical protein CALCODRAFT_519189 [Calocera cornea HHB12733]|uniref:Uncharacterized protein n=1 Tax=Calocera cornea HHB12733 TaxID=1353952 RepID=A0A165EEB0_9BASI|nr:hypothetical protein CALCODRAFT_519189 [Calocera cornea HHB12733]
MSMRFSVESVQEVEANIDVALQHPVVGRAALNLLALNPFSPVNGEMPPTPISPNPLMRILRTAAMLYHELMVAGMPEERARMFHLAHIVLHHDDSREVLAWANRRDQLEAEYRAARSDVSDDGRPPSDMDGSDDRLSIRPEEDEEEQALREQAMLQEERIQNLARLAQTDLVNDRSPPFSSTKLRNWISELRSLLRGFERAGEVQDENSDMDTVKYILDKVADSVAPALAWEGGHITQQALWLVTYFRDVEALVPNAPSAAT